MYRPDRIRKDGSHPIYLRITIKSKPKYFQLGQDILPKNFDLIKGIVKKSDPLHWQKNTVIENALFRASAIERYFIKNDKTPTLDEFVSLWESASHNPESVFGYIDYLIKTRKKTLAPATIEFYHKQKRKLQGFRPEIAFGQVNLHLLNKYNEWLSDQGHSQIYINKCMEFLRRVINAAVKEDKITKNPFVHFAIRNIRGQIQPLNRIEVASLEKLYNEKTLNKHQQNVLRYFLFCCYTGLRYSDIKALTFANIQDFSEQKWLMFEQKKTKKFTKVPLIPQAVNLLPESGYDKQRVFNVISNQPTGRHLKKIFEIAKIDLTKKVTFHSSRHTCSNLLYQMGVPLDIRALIIGDSEAVVRDRYTQPDMDLLIKAMGEYAKE